MGEIGPAITSERGEIINILTTPVMPQLDASCPGECWFFYWKTSAGLWRKKIEDWPSSRPILIPLYWGAHLSAPKVYDFGEYRPELDLCELWKMIQDSHKEAYFILAIGPSPFFPLGGLPNFAAKELSKNRKGLNLAALNSQQNIVPLYSFFGSQTFSHFQGFLAKFAQIFSEKKLLPEVFSSEFFFLEGLIQKSFLEDCSETFFQALGIYRDKNQNNLTEQDFLKEVRELYRQSISEIMPSYYVGPRDITLVGASLEDLILRSQKPWGQWYSGQHPYELALTSSCMGTLPSFVLLGENERPDGLSAFMKDFGRLSYFRPLQSQLYDDDDDFGREFTPIKKCFIDSSEQFRSSECWTSFQKHFPWCYQKAELADLLATKEAEKVWCQFQAHSQTKAQCLIKYFVEGNPFILARESLESEELEKIQRFVSENGLKTEKIFFQISFEVITLGETFALLYSAADLKACSRENKIKFWDKVWALFGADILNIESERPIIIRYLSRSTFPEELDFQEVRRVKLLNPSSYSVKIHIHSHDHFAFLKYVDQYKTDLKSERDGVKLYVRPKGHISVDYGYFL